MPKIDYSVRPAKNIERKMITEALGRLSKLESPEKYRYVGFGGLYFRDFSLLHRILGIDDMYSIEHEQDANDRYEFNLPFKCVKMCFGRSTDELPKIPLDEKKNIVWLDYESSLTMEILGDIRHVCSKALAGSVIITTLNARSGLIGVADDQQGEGDSGIVEAAKGVRKNEDPAEILRRQLLGKVPAEVNGRDLAGWGTAKLFHTIVENEINETLAARNGILDAAERIAYHRIFHFHYSDGAKMLTTGGILCAAHQEEAFAACKLDNLPYCKEGEHPYTIPSPRLTYRERRHLNLQLPEPDLAKVAPEGIPERDIELYSKVYRYFPNFSEVDI